MKLLTWRRKKQRSYQTNDHPLMASAENSTSELMRSDFETLETKVSTLEVVMEEKLRNALERMEARNEERSARMERRLEDKLRGTMREQLKVAVHHDDEEGDSGSSDENGRRLLQLERHVHEELAKVAMLMHKELKHIRKRYTVAALDDRKRVEVQLVTMRADIDYIVEQHREINEKLSAIATSTTRTAPADFSRLLSGHRRPIQRRPGDDTCSECHNPIAGGLPAIPARGRYVCLTCIVIHNRQLCGPCEAKHDWRHILLSLPSVSGGAATAELMEHVRGLHVERAHISDLIAESARRCRRCQDAVQIFSYVCLTCDDYELCPNCQRGDHHPDHFMIKVPSTPSSEHEKYSAQVKNLVQLHCSSKSDLPVSTQLD